MLDFLRCERYVVGGYVRDGLMGRKSKDIDIECFGIGSDELYAALNANCEKVSTVGKSFGVFKVVYKGLDYDVSLPRRENKTGVGHAGFKIESDPDMTLEEASSRRDFTINAISQANDVLVDPFGGEEDLRNRVLRHVGPQFSEDPLRVLRGFQFCGRFDLIAHPETLELCRMLRGEFNALPKDRIWTEWEKWALKSVNPKAGLDFLAQCWVDAWPELRNMLGCPQEQEWHPEGCVYTHTAWVCNAMNDICDLGGIVGNEKLVLMFAALCHDMGKPATTCIRKGRISAPGHDKAGVEVADSFLTSIKCPNRIKRQVLPLVRHHMDHINGVDEVLAKRLSVRLAPATVEQLCYVIEADHSGRPPLSAGNPASHLHHLAKRLYIADRALEPLIRGRHFDFDGPDLGVLLKWLFEKQQANKFKSFEEGMALAEKHEIFHKHRKAKV